MTLEKIGHREVAHTIHKLVEKLEKAHLKRDFPFLKKINREVDHRIYILSRKSHEDLRGRKGIDISIKHFDLKHLVKNKENVEELISRMVIVNKDNTVGLLIKNASLPIQITVHVKERGESKQAEGRLLGTMQAHQATAEEMAAINEAATKFGTTIEAMAQQTSLKESTEPAPSKEGRSVVETIDPFTRPLKEKHKPASKIKTKVEAAKKSSRSKKDMGQATETIRRMRKSREREVKRFQEVKEAVDEMKFENRERISENAKKSHQRNWDL